MGYHDHHDYYSLKDNTQSPGRLTKLSDRRNVDGTTHHQLIPTLTALGYHVIARNDVNDKTTTWAQPVNKAHVNCS